MKALIVDDSVINLKVAQKILEKFDVVVETVTNGEDCLKKIGSNKYDIIFMDIMMPVLDGVDTFKILKEKEGFAIPVVALTADTAPNAEEKYLNLGFHSYMEKPINIEKLQKILDSIK